jgi:hypothetical protein
MLDWGVVIYGAAEWHAAKGACDLFADLPKPAPARDNFVLKLWAIAALQSPRVHPYMQKCDNINYRASVSCDRGNIMSLPNSAAIPLPVGSAKWGAIL